jgi:uncharacterized protein with GYD domain
MAKFLIHASYSPEGLKGLIKDKASGRKAAVSKMLESLGGKLESFYYTFGDHDAIVIADVPDNVSAAAISIVVSSSGLAHTKTTPLLTIEETDKALGKAVKYQAPGKK